MQHPVTVALPLVAVLAEVNASMPQFSWTQTLLVYGPLGLWVAWFVIRDRLDREERKQERLDQERRHKENLEASKHLENALRTNTNSIITAMSAIKHIDVAYGEIFVRVKEENNNGAART